VLFPSLSLSLSLSQSSIPCREQKKTHHLRLPDRKAKGQQTRLEKDEEDVSLCSGRRHRKDNSEWGKRMEKELGQIEKRKEKEQNKLKTQERPRKFKMLSEREANEVAKNGEVERWGSDSEGDDEPIAHTRLELGQIEKRQKSGSDGDDVPIVQTVRTYLDGEKAIDIPTVETIEKEQESNKDR
jgi:hypothetical protein